MLASATLCRVGRRLALRNLSMAAVVVMITLSRYLTTALGYSAKLDRQAIACGALTRGLVVLSGGAGRNILCLTPPLTITKSELSEATRLLKNTIYGNDSSRY